MPTHPDPRCEPPRFPFSAGAAAERIRTQAWQETSLGPPEQWPSALRQATSLMLASPESMYVVWGDDLAFLHNDAYSPILGPRVAQAMGTPLRVLWADAFGAVEAPIKRAFSGEASRFDDVPIAMNRYGEPEDTWWTFSFSPIHDDAGHIGGALCVTKEVTDGIVARAALARENERLIALFEKSPMFMAFLSGPEHRVELANPRYVDLLGRRDVIGQPLAAVVPEVIEQGYKPLLDEVLRTGVPFIGKQIRYEPRVPLDDAPGPRLLDLVFQPVKGTDGHVAGVFVQGLDVTTQVDLQQSLRLSEARHRQILDSARDYAIFAMDLSGRITLWNEGARHILGWTEAEMLGTLPTRFYLDEDREARRFERAMQTALDQGGLSGERLFVRKSGEHFWAQGAMSLLHGEDGAAIGYVIVLRDRTVEREAIDALAASERELDARVRERTAELQMTEEKLRQSQKMEAVGQLTGGIAHDFNNLLTAVSMGLELLEMRVEQGRHEDLGRYVEMARSGANRATALTQRLLAFSRRQTLAPTQVQVEARILGMLDIISRSLGPSIEISTALDAAGTTVRVDGPQLENALLNLCINARDAMPEGGHLQIATLPMEIAGAEAERLDLATGHYVRLTVTDTGTGMTPDIVAKIFEPFFTTKPIGQGTGLGLSMIYGFTRQSGGQVDVDSRPGSGTAMHLYLPHDDGAADIEMERVDAGLPHDGRGRPQQTVLLVEDETAVRVLVNEVLVSAGYRVLEAAEGSAAVEILRSTVTLDLLITDVGLTGALNGRQVADAGRLCRPQLPVLFITGYAASAAVGAGQLAERMEVLTKPFTAVELAKRTAAMLRGVADWTAPERAGGS